MTVKVDAGGYIRFQANTGAQCKVLPLHIYKKATNDKKLENVQTMETSLKAYGGSKLKVVGKVPLRVWKNILLFTGLPFGRQ